jgi:hypothetical protein
MIDIDESLLLGILEYSTNHDGDPRRFKMLADAEHDDPEDVPTYFGEKLVLLGGVAWVTQETAEAIAA